MEKTGEESVTLVRGKIQTRSGKRRAGEGDEIGTRLPPTYSQLISLPKNKKGRRKTEVRNLPSKAMRN